MPIFKHNDIEINYIKRGKGEPLVLVQGLGQNLSGWTLQISFFKKHMNVIALDNRGVGKSSRPNYPYTMDMFVDDIKKLLDHLNIQEKIHLCGVSMGGMIAQNFVIKYPDIVKTVILCATAACHDPTSFIDEIKQSENLEDEERFLVSLNQLFSNSFIEKLKKNKAFYENLKYTMMFEDPVSLQDNINQASAIEKTHNTRESLHKIKQPTLIIAATEDKVIPIEESKFLNEKIPNSRLEVLKGLGHGFIVEESDKVNDLMWNFLKENLE
jgi:pimeloyl-ACP methyl ester carboxylesterase